MAIDRPLQTPDSPIYEQVDESDLEIEIVNPESVSVETPDGGVIIDFDPDDSDTVADHDSNLANFIPDEVLSELSRDLV